MATAAIEAATPADDEARLLRLEEQAEHGGGGAWEYLCLARKLRARRPAHVLRIGLDLLNNSSARSRLASERNALSLSLCPSLILTLVRCIDPAAPSTD
jgi:ER membrane protein complex subunit 2